MHITLFAFGSWGDVRPLVVLGKGLLAAGHQARILASPVYAEWVRARGLDFHPLTDDVAQIVNDLSDTEVLNPLQQVRIVREVLPPVFTRMGLDVLEATRDSDVLLTVEFSLAVLQRVIEQNRLKTVLINPAPLTLTAAFPSAAAPRRPVFLPESTFNRMSYRFGHQSQWALLSAPRKALEKQLGLPQQTFSEFRAGLVSVPALTVVSPTLLARPDDWEPHQQVTGYLFDDDEEWTPPQDLVDFLAAGEPPVYIGFGSMADHKPAETTRMLIDAVKRAGKRAVILSGWAKLGLPVLPENVHLIKFASHSWLFPQMAAVVHHGGAGTTAAGFRAGVPTIIVPHNADQPFWGRLVARLGLGPDPIPRKKLNADNLAAAIRQAVEIPSLKANAAALAEKIRQEDGLGEAVRWIGHFLV